MSYYLWWMLGRGYENFYESALEEENRYKKKLGILRIAKDTKDNNDKEPT